MSRDNHLRADALMVAVTLLAAAGWIFSKEALQGLPPLLFMGMRFLLASGLLVILGARQLRRTDCGGLKRAGATGVVMSAALMCWIMGLYHADTLGVGAFITSLGVVLVPVVGRLLFAVQVSVGTWLAVAVATLGLGFLSLEQGLRLAASDLYFLAAAWIFAIHFNLNTRFAARVPVIALTAVQLGVVGVTVLLVSLMLETWPTTVAAPIVGWFLASALIATSLRFFLQIRAQSMAPVSHAALIMTLEPFWASLLAWLWLGETLSALELTGCALIFLALLIGRWRWLLIWAGIRPERKPET